MGSKVKLKGSLGSSDHESVEFEIIKGERTALRKLTILGFMTADGLFRDLFHTLPLDKVLEVS